MAFAWCLPTGHLQPGASDLCLSRTDLSLQGKINSYWSTSLWQWKDLKWCLCSYNQPNKCYKWDFVNIIQLLKCFRRQMKSCWILTKRKGKQTKKGVKLGSPAWLWPPHPAMELLYWDQAGAGASIDGSEHKNSRFIPVFAVKILQFTTIQNCSFPPH